MTELIQPECHSTDNIALKWNTPNIWWNFHGVMIVMRWGTENQNHIFFVNTLGM